MFIKIFVLIAIFSIINARIHWKDVESYDFEKYVSEFKHPWAKGSEEWLKRRSYFLENIARIIDHNSKNYSWKETINHFSAMSVHEIKASSTGRSKAVAGAHKPTIDTSLPKDFILKPLSELPDRIDWRESNIVSAVKDQGYCGSCWAFAATSVIESAVAKETGFLFDFSVQQIAMCAPNPESCGGTGGCNGATAEIAFNYLATNSTGIHQEWQLSYSAYGGQNSVCGTPYGSPKAGITGYVQLPTNNYLALMNAVSSIGPIAISLDADFSSYTSGIYNGCNKINPDIDHAVVLMGYGEENGQKYWLVRNSWSPTWGEHGYIRISRFDNDDDNCGMDITPLDGNACNGDETPIKVCGTCGILSDSSYVTGAYVF